MKYIGRHKSNSFDSDYYGSGKYLLRAIKKYGIENFVCEILCECNSEDELNYWEEYYIDKNNAILDESFYNLKQGGIGKSVGGYIKMNNGISEKNAYPEQVDDLLKIGYVIGQLPQSEEEINKRARAHTGLKYSHSEKYNEFGSANIGRNLSEKHKMKLKEVQSSRVWVNNGVEEKHPKEKELNRFINLGWNVGRLPFSDELREKFSKAKIGNHNATKNKCK